MFCWKFTYVSLFFFFLGGGGDSWMGVRYFASLKVATPSLSIKLTKG